jgi:TP901 family phage tail tape measure protein
MLKTIATSVVIGGSLGKSYHKATTNASNQARILGNAFRETNKKLAAANGVIKYKGILGELNQKQAAAGGSNKRLAAGIKVVEKRYREAKKSARSYGIQVGDVINQQKKLERESRKLNSRMKAQNRASAYKGKFNAMRGSVLGSSAALYGIGRLFSDAADYDESGLYLRSVLNSNNKDQDLGKSLKHAREFAKNSLADENEVLEIEYGFNSAGLDAQISRMATETAHKVAKVTRGESSTVSEIIGTTFNNLGDSLSGTATDKLEQIGNILTKTQLKYQIRDFSQLGESMKYGASAAANYKVSLEDTAAVIGQLNSAGLQGSMAGTAFNAVLKGMSKASDQLGFSIVRTKDGQMDMVSTLESLKGSLEGLDTDERASVLQKLFGDEGTRGIVPLIDSLDQLKSGVGEITEASKSGLLDKEYDRFVQSASGQFKMFGQNIALVGRIFAGTLLPAVNTVITPIVQLSSWVAGMLEKFPILSWTLGAAAVGFSTVATGIGIVTGLTWLMNAAMAANPIGLTVIAIVGGIAAIGTAIALLWKNWDKVWGWIKDKALLVWDQMKKMFSWSPLGLIIKGWGKAFSWIENKFGIFSKTVGKIRSFFGADDESQTGPDSDLEQSKHSKVPGLAETTSSQQNKTDNRQDNRKTEIYVETNDPQEAAKAVSKALDTSPPSYDTPLADSLSYSY